MTEVITSQLFETEAGTEIHEVKVFYTEDGHRLGSVAMPTEVLVVSEEEK